MYSLYISMYSWVRLRNNKEMLASMVIDGKSAILKEFLYHFYRKYF